MVARHVSGLLATDAEGKLVDEDLRAALRVAAQNIPGVKTAEDHTSNGKSNDPAD